MPIRSKAIKSNEGANVLHHSLCVFFKSLKKNNIYKCVLSHHKTEIVLKNNNKEKINNYTYISHTSEWRFSQVTVTGLNSFRGKSSVDCPHLLLEYRLLFWWDCCKIHFMCMTEIKHNITSKEIKQIVFERIAETN